MTHTQNGRLTLAAQKAHTNSLVAGHADNCLGDFFQDKPLLMLKPPRAAGNYVEEVVLEGAAHFLREDTPPVLYCVIVQLEAEVAHRIRETGGGEAARDKNAEGVVVFDAFASMWRSWVSIGSCSTFSALAACCTSISYSPLPNPATTPPPLCSPIDLIPPLSLSERKAGSASKIVCIGLPCQSPFPTRLLCAKGIRRRGDILRASGAHSPASYRPGSPAASLYNTTTRDASEITNRFNRAGGDTGCVSSNTRPRAI